MSILTVAGGSVTAFGCVVTTVLVIWCIMTFQLASWYVPVSWLVLGLSMCAIAGLAVNDGWIAATSFAVTYALLSIVPPFIGFHVGGDAVAALVIGSVIIAVELACIIAAQVLLNLPSLLVVS